MFLVIYLYLSYCIFDYHFYDFNRKNVLYSFENVFLQFGIGTWSTILTLSFFCINVSMKMNVFVGVNISVFHFSENMSKIAVFSYHLRKFIYVRNIWYNSCKFVIFNLFWNYSFFFRYVLNKFQYFHILTLTLMICYKIKCLHLPIFCLIQVFVFWFVWFIFYNFFEML